MGSFDAAEQFAQTALETAKGYNDMAFRFYGALMAWTWWQRDDLADHRRGRPAIQAESTEEFPILRGARR